MTETKSSWGWGVGERKEGFSTYVPSTQQKQGMLKLGLCSRGRERSLVGSLGLVSLIVSAGSCKWLEHGCQKFVPS